MPLSPIAEGSIGKERRLTKTAIKQFESELEPLAKSPTEETLSLITGDAKKTGRSDLVIHKTTWGGGYYDAEVWCNPSESGLIYLRAYEITKAQRLFKRRLRESSESVGWSRDPQELFFAKFNFKIYEGDWGQYYGARFEVWFEPDSGQPERKLFEKN